MTRCKKVEELKKVVEFKDFKPGDRVRVKTGYKSRDYGGSPKNCGGTVVSVREYEYEPGQYATYMSVKLDHFWIDSLKGYSENTLERAGSKYGVTFCEDNDAGKFELLPNNEDGKLLPPTPEMRMLLRILVEKEGNYLTPPFIQNKYLYILTWEEALMVLIAYCEKG